MLKLTEQSIAEKALLHEITVNGVTHGTPDNPIISRDGQTGSAWVMSFLGAGLREPWLSSACDGLLRILDHFDGKQLATMGLAASSLLSGCILRSDRGHSGLMVRSEPKTHGSGKQIEGLGDKSEPVVIIDDAIGTGFSALKCAEILEANGYEVEGVVCVVSFSYDSGYGLLEERGFMVASLFDLYDDLAPIMQPDLIPNSDRYKATTVPWDNEVADSGLGVFTLARAALHYAFEFGALPKPPEFLAHPLDCDGGLAISLRRKSDGRPVGRGSVWCLPDDPETSAGELLLRACWQLFQSLPGERNKSDWLNECNLAISCFGPMEPCTSGGADNETYGIIVKSLDRPWVMGGALPNMPGIPDDLQQLVHAAYTNTGLRPLERFELFRHSVTKLIEPDANWPPGGQTKTTSLIDADKAGQARKLLELARKILQGEAVDAEDNLFFWQGDRLFVSVYDQDRNLACVGSSCRCSDDFAGLVAAAASDPRMSDAPAIDKLSLQVTVLDDAWSDAEPLPFATGKDALSVTVNGMESILLPNVAVEQNPDAMEFMEMLLLKAAADAAQVEKWTRYSCKSWSLSPDQPDLNTETSFPVARHRSNPSLSVQAHAEQWSIWLSHCVETGLVPQKQHVLSAKPEDTAGQALQAEIHLQLCRYNTGSGISISDLPVPGSKDAIDQAATAYRFMALKHSNPENLDRLADTLRQSVANTCIRTNWRGFWLCVSALAGHFENHEILSNRLIRRRANLPCSTEQRLIRLSALIDWQCSYPEADLQPVIDLELQWLGDCQSDTGVFNFIVENGNAPVLTAYSAEALARACALFPDIGLLARAERAHKYLTTLSVSLPESGAGLQQKHNSAYVCTRATTAALGAFYAYLRAKQ